MRKVVQISAWTQRLEVVILPVNLHVRYLDNRREL